MKLAQLTVAALFVGMTFVACEKDTKLPATTKNPVPAAGTEKAEDLIGNLFRQVRAQNTQIFQFNAGEKYSFTGAKGTSIIIQPGVLRYADGTIATGIVTARLIEIQGVEDQALMGYPTQNAWSQSNPEGGGAIQTAGAVDFTVTDQNGVQLTAPGSGVTIGINVDPSVGFDPDMRVWTGVPSIDQPRDNVWAQNPNEVPQGGGETQYKWNWMGRPRLNCDKLNNSCPGPTTPFKVDLPAPFVKANTEIYVVAQLCGSTGPKAVFALDMYSASPKYWYEHTAAGLTVGTNVDFVAIATDNTGQLYYKIENATIVPGHFQHMNGMMPISLAGLTAILAAL
jgi:hypothetical protein